MTVIASGSTTFVITVVLVYFVPTLVALYRQHHQTGAIVVINLFAGWTFIGWVAALAMACSAKQKPA